MISRWKRVRLPHLCQACNALFRLEQLAFPDSQLSVSVDVETGMAGTDLALALCLAQATADAGTFLYAGQELMRLVTTGSSCRKTDSRDAWSNTTASRVLLSAAVDCLREMTERPRRKTLTKTYSIQNALALLVFFCLDRARFFGEPAADKLLATLGRTMDLDKLGKNAEARNLNTPLRRFACQTNSLIL